ncbi:MAG TPA: hypothetical protein VFQ36_04695 [Ktedonobacteraceae bacterium]|nr:hypothetical protein [Ktedonobacteraceae bacterium]
MNLWAESDNPDTETHIAPTRAGTRFIASASASSRDNAVLPALRSWLLTDYVAPYCRSLAATRIFRRCFWLDGLGGLRHMPKKAGESQGREQGSGRDESRPYMFDNFVEAEQQTRDGSRPGKAAKKAQSEILPPALQGVAALAGELARESKPITLQAIALDNGKGGRVQDTFVLPKESTVINATWREAAPALLPAIEQFATIFLLNPLAVAKPSVKNTIPFMTVDEFAALFQRTTPTELCLVMMHRQVESVLLPALRKPEGAAAFTALLRSDRWKALLAREGEDAQRVDKVIDLWLTALQPHFTFVQRIAFPVLIGPATVEDAPCSLVFATRRQDSLVCMNDVVRDYRRRIEQESRRGILNEGWFAAQQAERDMQALRQLSEDTLREGRARAPRRWSDLRQQLLLERFGQWTLHEYDEVMCRLIQEDEVRCAWRQPEPADTSACRVPGNEDVLQWQWKKRRY